MRAVLLVLLTACGSSSFGATAAPLESSSAEHELASAPVEQPAGCYCPDVTVRCGGEADFHARADRATCTLDLPAKACKLFRFQDGELAHPEAILATIGPADLTGEDVFELCSAKHEAHHACDRRMDRPCAFEMDAYDVSLECMRAFASDKKVAHDIEGILAAREMNACLCAETSCGSCVAACREAHPTFEATCLQAEAVYCE